MKVAPKILGLLVIAALVLSMSAEARAKADQASAFSTPPLAASTERPAGCHAHGGSIPSAPPTHSVPPAPASHRCCLTGHDAALIPLSYRTPPCHPVIRVTLQIRPALTECSFNGLDVSKVLIPDSPGITPLRI
jgi:hypothetical protein